MGSHDQGNASGPIEAGTPLASGRAADVFDQGDGTVLRRYRDDTDSSVEARAMNWLADQGLPIPRVHHVDERDMVMDFVEGPTLLEDLEKRPWMILSHGRLLASLQKRVNALKAPDWFPTIDGVPEGDAVLHLDLHPMNVMLSPAGPVLIDWTNASRGAEDFDAAMSYLLMSCFEVDGLKDKLGQKLLVNTFALSRGRTHIDAQLATVGTMRLSDPNTTAGERTAINNMLMDYGPSNP